MTREGSRQCRAVRPSCAPHPLRTHSFPHYHADPRLWVASSGEKGSLCGEKGRSGEIRGAADERGSAVDGPGFVPRVSYVPLDLSSLPLSILPPVSMHLQVRGAPCWRVSAPS